MIKVEGKAALRDTMPVMAGYLVLGAGFGIIMNVNGYGVWWALAMSLFVYAGSMQFAAIGLLSGGASLLTVALTTLAVNARHLFYGISMVDRYKNAGSKKPYLIYALTDETYSLLCSSQKSSVYCFLVSLFNQIYWVSGTLIGSLLGNTLHFNTKGIDFALTALFITVFVDQWLNTRDHFAAVSGVLISVLCLLVFGSGSFLIPAMAVITAVLLLRRKKVDTHDA